MQVLKAFLNQNWVSSLVGITGVVTAIIGLLLYRASRIRAQLVYQVRATRILGSKERSLPEEVEILFKGRSISRLTKTHIIFWNSGNATVNGDNIIAHDPLRLEFSEATQVLAVTVPHVNRTPNKFIATTDSHSPNKIICSFDYLDPGNGAVVELLHNAPERYPKVKGVIRGVPEGPLNWGYILPPSRVQRVPFPFIKLSMSYNPRKFLLVAVLLGILMVALGLLLRFTQAVEPGQSPSKVPWVFFIFGLFYLCLSVLAFWVTRRRFPRSLLFEDLQDSDY